MHSGDTDLLLLLLLVLLLLAGTHFRWHFYINGPLFQCGSCRLYHGTHAGISEKRIPEHCRTRLHNVMGNWKLRSNMNVNVTLMTRVKVRETHQNVLCSLRFCASARSTRLIKFAFSLHWSIISPESSAPNVFLSVGAMNGTCSHVLPGVIPIKTGQVVNLLVLSQ